MYKFFDMLCNERGETGPKKDDDKDDDKDPKPNAGLDDSHVDDDITNADDDDGSVEINLDADDDDAGGDDDSPSNKAFAEMRVENKELKKTVDEMKTKIDELGQPQPIVAPTQTPTGTDPTDPMNWTEEQWDALAKSDWKKAVDLRSEIQARRIHTTATTNSEFNRVQEESKKAVLDRHPELGDINSEKSKIYKNIVTSNPEYVNQKKGPVHAMYEMENFLEKNMGWKREDIVKAETKARQDEEDRGSRVALTSTAGRNASQENKVILTKEDQEFCEMQGIDPKTFAANKKQLEKSGRGGIQL